MTTKITGETTLAELEKVMRERGVRGAKSMFAGPRATWAVALLFKYGQDHAQAVGAGETLSLAFTDAFMAVEQAREGLQ